MRNTVLTVSAAVLIVAASFLGGHWYGQHNPPQSCQDAVEQVTAILNPTHTSGGYDDGGTAIYADPNLSVLRIDLRDCERATK